MADDLEGGDDVGKWNCTACTLQNPADIFKCEMCGLRRGTSTRKPRCNADTIVAQVVKQQEQILQQTKSKTSPKSRASVGTAASSSDIAQQPRKGSRAYVEDSSSQSEDESPEPKKRKSLQTKSFRKKPLTKGSKNKNITWFTDDEASTDELSHRSSPALPDHLPAAEYSSNSESSTSSLEPTTSSPSHNIKNSENPFKIKPLEVGRNLIKYSPPTSSGRAGWSIDKKRFTQHSVTVDDVTITLTEFATRQNRYIRKKKSSKSRPKKSKSFSNGKSRTNLTKGESQPNITASEVKVETDS